MAIPSPHRETHNGPEFNDRAATQMAARILQRCPGESATLFVLLKLIYLVEQHALKHWGAMITWDSLYSFKNRPAPSKTYNLLKEPTGYWAEHINSGKNRTVSIGKNPGRGELADADLELIDTIVQEWLPHLQARKFRDNKFKKRVFPEWSDPGESSTVITAENILANAGKSSEEIAEITSGHAASAFAASGFNP